MGLMMIVVVVEEAKSNNALHPQDPEVCGQCAHVKIVGGCG
jgi:hypothetical protein